MADLAFSGFTAGSTNQVPSDELVGLDVSALPAAQNTRWTLNNLFSKPTRNITDGAMRFAAPGGAPSVSAAAEGAFYFDGTNWKFSSNGAAYVTLGNVSTAGFTATRIPIASAANTLTDDDGLSYNTTTNFLTVGTTSGGGIFFAGTNGNNVALAAQAPAATHLYYLPNAAPTAGQFLYAATTGAQTQLGWQTAPSGSGSANQVAVWGASNALTGSSSLTFSSSVLSALGAVNGDSGFFINQTTSGTAAQAGSFLQTTTSAGVWALTSALFTASGLRKANQLYTLGATGTVEMLFQLADASTRFVYGVNGVEAASINATASLSLVLGAASTLTGRVRMYNSAGTTYTQLSAGNAAASLNYILPATSPTAGQVLTAAAPSGSDVNLSWGSASGGAPVDAQYLVLALDGTLTNERQFTPQSGIVGTDNGAGGTYELAVDVSFSPTWTGLHTWNRGTTLGNAITVDAPTNATAGQTKNSHRFSMIGRSNDGSPHSSEFRWDVNMVSPDAQGAALRLQQRVDSGAFSTVFQVEQGGIVTAPEIISPLILGTVIYNQDPVADIRFYGAVSGAPDNTAAIQAALNASRNVFIPPGTWIASNLNVALSNTRIFGVGRASVLQQLTGATGALLTTGANAIELESLDLFGGNTGSYAGTASSPANRTGLLIQTQLNSSIRNCTISGFANYGLLMADTTRDRLAHLKVSDSAFFANWTNIQLGNDFAEYLKLVNVDVFYGRFGLVVASGNIQVSNSKITDNGIGVYVLGTAIGNNAHGSVDGCLINHNGVYSIWCVDVTNGFAFTGCNVFDGDIYLQRSSGVNINEGIIDVNNYYLEGGNRNYIRDNFIVGSYTNTVNHNYNGVADNTLLIDNYKAAGTALEVFSANLATNQGLSLTPSSITSALPGLSVVGTLSGSGAQGAVIDVTSSGSSGAQKGCQLRVNSGYTGSRCIGLELLNGAAGTGTALELSTSFDNPSGNSGLNAFAWATTVGTNIATYSEALGGNLNVGLVGKAITAKNSAVNIGVIGVALNTGTSPIQIGGYFGQQTTQASIVTQSAALIANNGAQTSPIFLGLDNDVTVFSILDGGNICIGGASSGTSATNTIAVKSGTAPATSPADAAQFYVLDAAAGDAQALVRNEAGRIARLTGTVQTLNQTFAKTNTTLANITGSGTDNDLAFNVETGSTYAVRVALQLDAEFAAGGVKVALGGTVTLNTSLTALQVQIYRNDTNVIAASGRISNTASAVSASGAADGSTYFAIIEGTIVVTTGGTLTAQFAQASASGTSNALPGCYMEISRQN